MTVNSIQSIIRDLKTQGISILITDHAARETLQITDRSYVIRSGQVLCQGRPHDVLNNPEARKYYFGEGLDLGPEPRRGHTWRSRAAHAGWTMSPPANRRFVEED